MEEGGDWLDWEFEGREHVCATNGKLIIISRTRVRVRVREALTSEP